MWSRKQLFVTFLVLPLIEGLQENDTTALDSRQLRVKGRTVKLYSHPRPEPIRCLQEGFQADPVDCTVFYRCVSAGRSRYNVYRFQCAPGTFYDIETEVCNHQQYIKRLECRTPPSLPALKNVESNNDNEIDFEQSAPFPIKPIIFNRSTDKITTTSSWITPPVHQPLTTSDTSVSYTYPSATDYICSEDGFTGDIKDCSKFYRCMSNSRGGYVRHEFSCSKGTIWDEELRVCNHPEAIKRSKCGVKTINDEKFESNKSSYLSAESILNVPVYATENTFAQDQSMITSNEVHYGERIKKTQKNDAVRNAEYFNNNGIVTTTFKYSFTHPPRVIKTETDKPYKYNYLNNFDENVSDNQLAQEINHITAKLPVFNYNKNKCTFNGFMGDKYDLKKFYRCVDDGKGGYSKYEFLCGEGTIWDPKIEACNHAWAVKDYGGDNHNLHDSTKNYSVIDLMTQISITKEPQIQNENNFNRYNDRTTTESNSLYTTERNVSSSKICTSSGFVRDVNDCRKFYRCVDDGKGKFIIYEFYCGQGTVWDPKIEACNHVWTVDSCHFQEITGDTTLSVSQATESQLIESENQIENGYHTSESIPTTTTSEKNKICTKEGFVGDAEDCKKFYRCVNNEGGGFIQYEFNCGQGTVWDSEINSCNHEKSVKNCNRKQALNSTTEKSSSTMLFSTDNTSTDELSNGETDITTKKIEMSKPECTKQGFLEDKNDCERFYRCVDNGNGTFILYEFSCGQGTEWNSELQTCDHPKSEYKCEKQIHHESNVQKPNEETSTTITTTTTVTDNKLNEYNFCTTDGFFADYKDCTKFYRCVSDEKGGYTKYEFTCGEGTMWDQNIQSCIHKSEDKNCSSYVNNKPMQSNTTESTITTSKSTLTTKIDVTSNAYNNISDECTDDGFYANKRDCKKFYRCVSNDKGTFTKYDFSCGEGTVWVQEIQACDHKSDSINCEISSSTNSTTVSIENGSETSVATIPQSAQEDEYPTEPNPTQRPGNDNRCVSEGFFGNEEDCKKFYRCVDNGNGGFTKYDFVCGEGTAWDTDLQTCNHEDNVENCRSINSDKQPTTVPENDTYSSSSSSTTNESPGTTIVQSTTKGPQNHKSDECDQEGYFGNKRNCKKFYRCVDNGKGMFTKYDFDCGEGTIWDQDIIACNHPRDVVNPTCEESQSESSSTEKSEPQTTTQSSISTNNTTENQSEQHSCKISSFECPKEGFYANPNDCKKFYRCVDWDGKGEKFSVFHFDCGEGTIWDPALETCNYEDSVYPRRDCNCKQSVSETTEKTTTQKFTTQEETTTLQTTQKEMTTTEIEIKTTQSPTQSETEENKSTTQWTTTQQETIETESTMLTTTESTTQTLETEKPTTEQETSTQQSTQETELTTQQTTTEEATTHMTPEIESSTQTSTTSEVTTVQQSTTGQESTTQETTTARESTMQQSTIEQDSTTQEMTSEQYSVTEQQSTTQEEDTTPVSTTENSTVETSTENATDDAETDGSTDQNTTESSSHEQCPEIEEDQYLFICETGFRRHHKYCNLFYQCSEEKETHDVKIAIFTCPNNTIYDESKTKCVNENEADKKCNGEIAERRRYKFSNPKSEKMMLVSRDLHTCSASGHYPIEKGNECSSVFMNCVQSGSGKIRPYIYRCPSNYVYWSVSRRCEPLEKLAYCRNMQKDWSQRGELPVERKNIAP